MLTKEVLAAILFLMLVQSGASSTSSSVSASPSVTNSYSSATPGSSSSASNSASPMGSSSQTYPPTTSTVTNTVTITVTNTVTSDVTSTVTHIVNQTSGMTISPTAAGTWGVSPSSMLSGRYHQLSIFFSKIPNRIGISHSYIEINLHEPRAGPRDFYLLGYRSTLGISTSGSLFQNKLKTNNPVKRRKADTHSHHPYFL